MPKLTRALLKNNGHFSYLNQTLLVSFAFSCFIKPLLMKRGGFSHHFNSKNMLMSSMHTTSHFKCRLNN